MLAFTPGIRPLDTKSAIRFLRWQFLTAELHSRDQDALFRFRSRDSPSGFVCADRSLFTPGYSGTCAGGCIGLCEILKLLRCAGYGGKGRDLPQVSGWESSRD